VGGRPVLPPPPPLDGGVGGGSLGPLGNAVTDLKCPSTHHPSLLPPSHPLLELPFLKHRVPSYVRASSWKPIFISLLYPENPIAIKEQLLEIAALYV